MTATTFEARYWTDSKPRTHGGKRSSHRAMWDESTPTLCGRARYHYNTARWIYACTPAHPDSIPGRNVVVPVALRSTLTITRCAYRPCACCGRSA